MKLLQILWFSTFFIFPVFSQDLQARLNELGLYGFAQSMAGDSPELLALIGRRNDITVWAPGNDVLARLSGVKKRSHFSRNSAQVDHSPEPPTNLLPSKRQLRPDLGYPDTNFQTIFTFLTDPAFVNLGPNQPARFTKNYGVALDGGATTAPSVEIVTGLGNTQFTVRGPFKFANGVIYEVNDFFTMPETFSATMRNISLAQNFYNTVVSAGQLPVFEETPAITVFAPIDISFATRECDPTAFVLTGPTTLYYSPTLIPGTTIVTRSGDVINITVAPNGGKLVNGRRLVRPNIPMKNGVIHFIDGPLFGSGIGGCRGNYTRPPVNITSQPTGHPVNITSQSTGPPLAQMGGATRQDYAAGALVLAFVASFLAFYYI